jgi:hypothetical protein
MAWSDVRWESHGETSADLRDDEDWHELASRGVRLARDTGALTSLPVALTYHAGLLVFAGEFAAATALLDEANAIAAATRMHNPCAYALSSRPCAATRPWHGG